MQCRWLCCPPKCALGLVVGIIGFGTVLISLLGLRSSCCWKLLLSTPFLNYSAMRAKMSVPHALNFIDLKRPVNQNFTCLKTSQLFKVIRTTICTHGISDFTSSHYYKGSIYEEQELHLLFRFFMKYPHLGLIDIGANIGTYTMFAAAMHRSVIAIECFRPNYMRIVKAIQIENLHDHVILLGNALHSQSGVNIHLSFDPQNIGHQSTLGSNLTNRSLDDSYVVQAMRFDDLLPIIKQTKIQAFLLKADIEGSEYQIFESGARVFDSIQIPVIFMEWDKVPHHKGHAARIINFLTARHYIPTSDTCKRLDLSTSLKQWPTNVFWTKLDSSEIC